MTWIKPHVHLRERPPRASVFDESISPRLRLARIIQAQFRNMCQSKAQLRDVMRSYSLPLPLRLLDARVLTARRATVIRRLALMNPSTLAQIIPATRQKQNAWLQALQNWCEEMASRPETNDFPCLFFEWAATNYPGVTYTGANEVRHTADFVGTPIRSTRSGPASAPAPRSKSGTRTWPKWLNVPTRRSLQWSTTRHYRYSGSTAALASSRCKLERRCTRKVLPCTIASFTTGRTWSMVRASTRSLRTAAASRPWNSSRPTQHKGPKRIGQHSRYQVSQLGGARNSRPAPEVAEAVGTCVEEINNRVRVVTTAGAIDQLLDLAVVIFPPLLRVDRSRSADRSHPRFEP